MENDRFHFCFRLLLPSRRFNKSYLFSDRGENSHRQRNNTQQHWMTADELFCARFKRNLMCDAACVLFEWSAYIQMKSRKTISIHHWMFAYTSFMIGDVCCYVAHGVRCKRETFETHIYCLFVRWWCDSIYRWRSQCAKCNCDCGWIFHHRPSQMWWLVSAAIELIYYMHHNIIQCG